MNSNHLRNWSALLLLFCLTPGVGEVVENFDHLIFEGHFAHAEASGDDHSESDPEHGCNGPFHLCSCHLTLSFVAPSPATLSAVAPPGSLEGLPNVPSPRAGYHQVPERPPCA